MLLCCCSRDGEARAQGDVGRTLVVYYSYTGNCRDIVTTLTSQIQADVLEIQPAEKGLKYEANGYALGTKLLDAIKANPNDASSYPAIDPVAIPLDGYENIVVVTPLWWSQMAAPMQTYLFQSASQMAGKHVGLIVSSHSSGISGVVSDARRLLPNVTWMGEALWINAANHARRATLVSEWVKTLNFAEQQSTMDKMYITIDGATQSATLEDNAAARALVERLRQSPVTVALNSSGGFEIWGALGFALPTSDQQMTTQPGDIVLYNGSNVCLFYGENSWSYTRLGRIEGLTESELRTFLKAGENGIGVTLSMKNLTAVGHPTSEAEQAVYDLGGRKMAEGAELQGIYIKNDKKVLL